MAIDLTLTPSMSDESSSTDSKPRCHCTKPPYRERQALPEPRRANFEYSPGCASGTPKSWARAKLRQESPLELEARPEAVAKLFSLLMSIFFLRRVSRGIEVP